MGSNIFLRSGLESITSGNNPGKVIATPADRIGDRSGHFEWIAQLPAQLNHLALTLFNIGYQLPALGRTWRQLQPGVYKVGPTDTAFMDFLLH